MQLFSVEYETDSGRVGKCYNFVSRWQARTGGSITVTRVSCRGDFSRLLPEGATKVTPAARHLLSRRSQAFRHREEFGKVDRLGNVLVHPGSQALLAVDLHGVGSRRRRVNAWFTRTVNYGFTPLAGRHAGTYSSGISKNILAWTASIAVTAIDTTSCRIQSLVLCGKNAAAHGNANASGTVFASLCRTEFYGVSVAALWRGLRMIAGLSVTFFPVPSLRSKSMKSLFNLSRRLLSDDKASEMTEVGVVLALIVLASIVILRTLGNSISTVYSEVNNNLANV